MQPEPTTDTTAQRDALLQALQRFFFDLGMTENIEHAVLPLAIAFRSVGVAVGSVDTRLIYRAIEAARRIHHGGGDGA